MRNDLPLKPTAFLDSKGNISPAWYTYLTGLSGRNSFTIPNKYIFTGDDQEEADTARDAYFTDHPAELVNGVKIISYHEFQQYDSASTTWLDVTEVIQGTGAQGPQGEPGPQGPQGNPSVIIADNIEMEWNDNVATVSEEDWATYTQFDIDYQGAHFSFNKDYSDTVQFCQGNGSAYRCTMNRSNRTFTFTPYSASETVVLGIPASQMFATSAARNTYFSDQDHANALAQCPYSLLGTSADGWYLGLYTGSLAVPVVYDNTKWVDGGIITRGPQGQQGEQGPQGIQGLQGIQGEPGISPTVTVLTSTTSTYILRITFNGTHIDTPNLMGPSNINDAVTGSDSTWSSQKIAGLITGTQTWQPSLSLVSQLPTVVEGAWSTTPTGWSAYDETKNYLCRIIADTSANNAVYQLVAGATSWSRYSDNQDFVDENELAVALSEYKKQLKIRTVSATGTGVYAATVAADENLVINCSKTAGSIQISHAAVPADHTGTIECLVTLKTGSFACPVSFAAAHKVINGMMYEAAANSTTLLVFTYIEALNAWAYGAATLED